MDAAAVVAKVRQANTEIAAIATDAGFTTAVPFICECGETSCRGLALLSLDAFQLVGTQPSWTVLGNAHGVQWRIVDTNTGETVKESRLEH